MKGKMIIVWILLILSLFSCKKNKNPVGSYTPSSVENNLIFERSDGSQVQFEQKAFVWCGPWEKILIPVNALHIWFGFDPTDPDIKATWRLRAVLNDVKIGEELKFPNSFIWDQPKGVLLSVLDAPNELSTQEGGSRGGIIFQKLECDIKDEVQFSIDAVIGSEFHDGDSLRVSGTFRATVSGLPYWNF